MHLAEAALTTKILSADMKPKLEQLRSLSTVLIHTDLFNERADHA